MALIGARPHPGSAAAEQNRADWRSLLDALAERRRAAALGGSERARERHVARGKLLARERIARLLDPNSPFLEIGALAAYGMYEGDVHAGGLIAGIGRVEGRETMIVANDPTIKGGAYYPITVKKHLRAQEIAAENRLPCVYLVDSGGANLPHQAEVFPDREHFGRIFYNQARMSAAGIVADRGGDGLVYRRGRLCPGDGGRDHHRRRAGHDLPRRGRRSSKPPPARSSRPKRWAARTCTRAFPASPTRWRATMATRCIWPAAPSPTRARPTRLGAFDEPRPPALPIEELEALMPVDVRKAFDAHDIIARLVDASEFDAFKPRYGATLVTGFARLGGQPIGILANNGVLFSESALKGAHFVQLCAQRGVPLLFLQNISGFMVGQRYEAGGIAKDGAKLVNAVANANVPKITLIVGGSFGAGNYGMAGRAYSPRFLFSWPNARISVMGGEQAASVLATLRRDALAAEDKLWSEEEEEAFKAPIRAKYEAEGSPYYATARLWDDGILMPSETRRVLALAFSVCRNVPFRNSHYGVFRM